MPWYENRSGHKLWYDDQGEGTPIILLHGWGVSSAIWRYQIEGLGDRCRVITPDLRGHGNSKIVDAGYDFPAFADDLVDLVTALDLHKVLLVGWSMGAEVATQAYSQIADRFCGLVLVSATPCFIARDRFRYGLSAAELDGMRLKVRRGSRRALDGFYGRLFEEGELDAGCRDEIDRLLAGCATPDTPALLGALDALAGADMRPLLPEITVPTLIVNGDCDRICLPQASRFLADSIPGSVQREFNGCGHAPFLSRPGIFNAEIISFIERCRCGAT
ncbi:MAG TPA: alpha/beta hydrolase [Desulfuromonadales bacterium]|nr:alpha/beta hydrolase [Desulfuromonadales bacterium]